MSTLAIAAAVVAIGGWLGIRDKRRRETDLAAFLVTLPVREWGADK